MITIQSIKPGMGTAFVRYLDDLEYRHAPDWRGCYCRFYQESGSYADWMARTHDQNRSAAIDAIDHLQMMGYLAFDGDLCVGWLNANQASAYPRLLDDLKPLITNKLVGLTICFVIRPEFRGQGVARSLLASAIEGFRLAGYDAAIALPIVREGDPEKRYRGTLHMYEEAGYVEIERHDSLRILWLDLKKPQ